MPDRSADPKPPTPHQRRVVLALVATVVFAAVAAAAFVLFASVRAFDVDALSRAHAAYDDASGRKPGRDGCALSESVTAAGCVKAKVTSVREEEVAIPSSIPHKHVAALKGTLTLPVGLEGERRPAVVFLHGSEPTDRDETTRGDLVSRHGPVAVLRSLAELFAREGIVALRWDKRHCPRCYPSFPWGRAAALHEISWLDLLVDARDALAFLAQRDDVDPRALVVVGHSEGGLLAPNVAFGRDDVAAVVMLAPLFSPIEDQSISQLHRAADLRAAQWDFVGARKLRQMAGAYETCRAAVAARPTARAFCAGVTHAAWADFRALALGTPGRMSELRCPVAVIQGTVDRNIDPDVPRRVGASLAGGDVELHYVRGIDHDLVDVVSPTEPAALDPAVVERVSRFLASVKRNR